MDNITINGEEYVKKSSVISTKGVINSEGFKYVLVRTDRAGVFTGYLKSEKDTTVVLTECRRLWFWSGAASLSELAVSGVSKPLGCKFPIPVAEIKIMGVIEIIPTTDLAKESIDEVPVWTVR